VYNAQIQRLEDQARFEAERPAREAEAQRRAHEQSVKVREQQAAAEKRQLEATQLARKAHVRAIRNRQIFFGSLLASYSLIYLGTWLGEVQPDWMWPPLGTVLLLIGLPVYVLLMCIRWGGSGLGAAILLFFVFIGVMIVTIAL
jgi:hypothetical protein